MNHQNTLSKKTDLSAFTKAIFKAFDLGLFDQADTRTKYLILAHKCLNCDFNTAFWNQYRSIARNVYRTHLQKGGAL